MGVTVTPEHAPVTGTSIPFSHGGQERRVSYGHGPSISSQPNKPAKSAFVMGTYVIYTTDNGRRVPGLVVGPDQDYFPSPPAVFVSFPSNGLTHLLPVTDLEVAEGAS